MSERSYSGRGVKKAVEKQKTAQSSTAKHDQSLKCIVKRLFLQHEDTGIEGDVTNKNLWRVLLEPSDYLGEGYRTLLNKTVFSIDADVEDLLARYGVKGLYGRPVMLRWTGTNIIGGKVTVEGKNLFGKTASEPTTEHAATARMSDLDLVGLLTLG